METVITLFHKDALLLLAVAHGNAGQRVALHHVMAFSDHVNRDIPSEKSFERGFTQLLQSGLVVEENRLFSLSPAGAALLARFPVQPNQSIPETWELVADVLKNEPFPAVCETTFTLQDGEAEAAYKTYSGEFSAILDEIEKDENAEQMN